MKDDIFLMSKIQFYKDNKLLTIRTKNYPNYINKASNIHLLRKNNGIIIYFNNGTHFQFLRIDILIQILIILSIIMILK